MLGSFLVDPLRAAMFAVAHLLGGSLGAGIFTVSFLLRLALLPMTLRLARRANAQRRILLAIKPELKALGKRHSGKPDLLLKETNELYRRVGYRQFDTPVVLGNLARLPILGGIYGALRQLGSAVPFAWIPDLARPNALLACLVAAASGAVAYLGGVAGAGRAPVAIAAVATGISLIFFWHFSAGMVLSFGASSLIDLAQGLLLVRQQRRAT